MRQTAAVADQAAPVAVAVHVDVIGADGTAGAVHEAVQVVPACRAQ